MRKLLLACFALIVLFSVATLPAAAANYNGILLDGRAFRAVLYDSRGANFGIVFFLRDEAHALLGPGQVLTINLFDDEVVNPQYIAGKTLDGHFWRISIDDASFLFQTQIAPMLGLNSYYGSGIPFGMRMLPNGMIIQKPFIGRGGRDN